MNVKAAAVSEAPRLSGTSRGPGAAAITQQTVGYELPPLRDRTLWLVKTSS